MQNKVLAINDISCVGRCSLTVALPIISSAKIECSILPTAILSTHTGGFTGFTFTDFTSEMMNIANHWKSLNISFDSIYTGFLGSIDQVDVVKEIVKMFKTENNKLIVDPAMADNGEMYKIFSNEFAMEMKKLCIGADVVIPNITEACFIAGVEYQKGPHTKEFIDLLVEKLGLLNIKNLVLTGVAYDNQSLGALAYNYETKEQYYYKRELINDYFHGTGDCFASAFVASYTNGKDLFEATKLSVDFTVNSILKTVKYPNIDKKYGVCFEEELPSFSQKFDK